MIAAVFVECVTYVHTALHLVCYVWYVFYLSQVLEVKSRATVVLEKSWSSLE